MNERSDDSELNQLTVQTDTLGGADRLKRPLPVGLKTCMRVCVCVAQPEAAAAADLCKIPPPKRHMYTHTHTQADTHRQTHTQPCVSQALSSETAFQGYGGIKGDYGW